jgi:hypothetical protein
VSIWNKKCCSLFTWVSSPYLGCSLYIQPYLDWQRDGGMNMNRMTLQKQWKNANKYGNSISQEQKWNKIVHTPYFPSRCCIAWSNCCIPWYLRYSASPWQVKHRKNSYWWYILLLRSMNQDAWILYFYLKINIYGPVQTLMWIRAEDKYEHHLGNHV